MGMPVWAWIVFYVLVFIMLIADLKMFGKKGQHEVGVKEALKMTGVWIAVSLVFSLSSHILVTSSNSVLAGEDRFELPNARVKV